MENFRTETRREKVAKPFIPECGYWIIGGFFILLGFTFFCLFDIPKRITNSVGKIHFSLPTKAEHPAPAQAVFDYPTKIREAADLMQETGNKILQSATDSAKAKELIFRARLKSRARASSEISKNKNEILVSLAVGGNSLGAIGKCTQLFEEIPSPP